uniref:Uncharacterized protein n=1 Tax=viral metagenome TaxID=1070528 RepID=A0A6M3MG44_9ZZZZ
MTERIYVHVEDAELRELSSRLDTSMERMRKVDVDTAKLDASTKAVLTQLPLLREANMLQQRIKALGTTLEAGGMGLGPIAAALLLMQVIMTLIDRLTRMQEQIIRDRGAHETMVRDGLDLTHEEWEMLSREQTGWVTDWEASVEKSKGDFFAAAEDYMRALYVRYTVSPSEPAIMSWEIGDENLP